MVEDSVFTKIIKNELPAHKVYEDELTIAFLPLYPIAVAHVLVVPKLQVDSFYDLPDKDYQALMNSVKKVAKRMREVVEAKRVGLRVEGLDVPHAHVHVLAFNNAAEFNEVSDPSTPVDHNKLAQMADKLAF
jgi:histidine triad (HIT) family protein